MTTIVDQHLATVSAAPNVLLPVKQMSVRIDETWSPYVQGNIVCALPDDLDLTLLDPRENARVHVELKQSFGRRWPLAELTALAGSGSMADLTAVMGGAPLGQLTNQLYRPWNAFGVRAPAPRRFDLFVTERTVDHVAAEITLRVASGEALLQLKGLVDSVRYTNTGPTTVRALTQFVLTRLLGATLEPGTEDAAVAAEQTEWLPGVSGWEYLTAIVEQADLRLWCDERGRWRLTERAPLTPGQLTLRTGPSGTLTSARDIISREREYAADAVVVTYRWTDDAGAQQLSYDVAGDATGDVYSIVREQRYPGPGAAESILRRSRGRGRELELLAVSNYEATTGQAFLATLPNTPIQTGVVAAVEWNLPEAEMRVVTRGLADTPETAYAFGDAGISYSDVPVGTDYTEFDWSVL